MRHPTYLRNGKIVLGTAAFKEHAAVNFWRGQELGLAREGGAMGQLGKLTSVDDLPEDLDALIAKAAEVSAVPPAPRPGRAPKPVPDLHPDFAAALDKAPKAKATLDAFPPSCRREYLEWIAEAKGAGRVPVRVCRCAAQQCLDTRQKLDHFERLCQIIVGS